MAWLKATRAPLTERPSRTSRWLMLVGALSVAAIGIGLLVLMTQATGNRERYNQNYEWLVLINAVVASGLLITILWGMVRLLRSLYKANSVHACWSSSPAFLPWWGSSRVCSCMWCLTSSSRARSKAGLM